MWFFGHPEVNLNILGKGDLRYRLKEFPFRKLKRKLGGINSTEFREILAGIIDSEGSIYFKEKGGVQITIAMHKREKGVLEYLKGIIGGGKVIEIKGKEACKYVLWRKEDVKRVADMINGELRLEEKRKQFNSRIVGKIEGVKETKKPLKKMKDSYWLAGMVMGDGSLQIKVLIRRKWKDKGREEVRLGVQMDLKRRELLEEIKEEMGGNIGYRKSQDTYYYSSTNYKSADRWVEYLDKYKMIGPKYEEYKLWRRVWKMIKEREHLKKDGIEEIKEIKRELSKKREPKRVGLING